MEYVITFTEEYELRGARCDNFEIGRGFTHLINEDGEVAFTVNNRYVKDISMVEDGDNQVVGIEVEMGKP